MKKILSLIKANMTENMNLFKIKNKNQSELFKRIVPVILFGLIFFSIWSYAEIFIEPLKELHLEYILLTIFITITSLLTLIEGIYKSSSLLFDCKDDDLLFSLPIKRTTVLFIRIFKFYIFELLYNSLFLIPAMFAYIRYVNVSISYYIVSIIAIFLLPIIPIIISCLVGFITTSISSKFKYKNIAQIVITMAIVLMVLFASYNFKMVMDSFVQNAENINDIITKVYYPAGAYIKLITQFNLQDLFIFVGVHLLVFIVSIFALSKIYFKINSSSKIIRKTSKNKTYKVITSKPLSSLIKKELNRFINSPVFVINAGFGLVLYIIACIVVCVQFDSLPEILANMEMEVTLEQIKNYIPVIVLALICFASFLSSITSSMISLEGKSFNILKSLPIKPSKIILSKIYAAVLIMIPFILVGDIIFFLKFRFNIFEIVGIIVASFLLPLISETIGILINLKYPKMNAENDTEVVKQSMSSTIAVFLGIFTSGLTTSVLTLCAFMNIPNYLTILIEILICTILYLLLLIYLSKRGVKDFNKINV